MKTWVKIIIIIAFIGLLSAFLVWKYVINKPHPDISKAKAEVEVIASDLFSRYSDNKVTANQSFTGKVIQLKGKISKIEQTDSSAIVIFVFRQGTFGDEGIRCVLLPEEKVKIKDIIPNQELTLKGLCTGYNETDVMVEKCIIVKE